MEKIFKNDKIMGLIAVVTLALVGYLCYVNYKNKPQNEENTTVEP